MKKVFAVLGDPIEHSLSPIMHNAAFEALDMDCTYHAFRVKKNDLENALQGAKAMGFGGLNLTVPLKETALSFVDADPLAAKIGASPRVLQYAFQDTLEITPMSYILNRKLHAARSDLKRSGADVRSQVTRIAMLYGMYHLGRFSTNYKQLFGELPSSTLKQCSI